MPQAQEKPKVDLQPPVPDIVPGGEEQDEQPERRHWKLLVHGLNLLLLLVLLVLFMAWAVERRQDPIYGWVAGTPIESFCRAVGPFCRRSGSRLAREKPLLPEERRQAAPLLARLDELQPHHVVLLRDRTRYFGVLKEDPETGGLTMHHYDGQRFQKTTIDPKELVWRRPVVVPPAELQASDVRFLLRYADADPYLLPPYLFAANCDYAGVQMVHFALSRLTEQFRREFAPLIDEQLVGHYIHVRLFPSRLAFVEAVKGSSEYGLVNSVGFFRKTSNTLFLCQVPRQFAHDLGRGRSGETAMDPEQIIRHEGAHQLSVSLGVFGALGEVPLWLEEGLAQYCQTEAFGTPLPGAEELLRRQLATAGLLPWEELMTVRELPVDEQTQQLVYAQAWLLFAYCMQPPRRQRFFRYLSELEAAGMGSDSYEAVNHLMNHLETTPERLAVALRERLTAGSSGSAPGGNRAGGLVPRPATE